MPKYIALFRAINVLGNNLLPMKDLKSLLEELGAENVKTYIQSGNVFLSHKEPSKIKLEKEIGESVKKKHGFEPKVLLLKLNDIKKAAALNPFPEGEKEPRTVHLFFLAAKPKNPEFKKMDEIKLESERYKLIDKIFYLHTPDGFGPSKLGARAEKLLGVPATARNWRTIKKLLEMGGKSNN